jgi:hypothetical protein
MKCINHICCLGIPCCLLKQCKCAKEFTPLKEKPTPNTPIKTPSEILQDQLEPIF